MTRCLDGWFTYAMPQLSTGRILCWNLRLKRCGPGSMTGIWNSLRNIYSVNILYWIIWKIPCRLSVLQAAWSAITAPCALPMRWQESLSQSAATTAYRRQMSVIMHLITGSLSWIFYTGHVLRKKIISLIFWKCFERKRSLKNVR